MLFSDLLPYLIGQGPVGTGPQLPNVPKAQSSFTGQNVPAVRMSTPSELMAAFNQMAQTPSEIELRKAQSKLAGLQGSALDQQVDIMKQLPASLQGVLEQLGAGGQGGAAGGAAKPAVWGDIGGGTASGRASVGGGGGSSGGTSDPRGLTPYIRETADKYGVDPDTAVAVAGQEGLGNPIGDHGKSGGAFQLYTGGGVGNLFQRDTGLDPLDLKNEKATIDYALKHASLHGWGDWNGAKKIGITGFMGIGRGGGGSASPLAAVPDFSGRFAGNEGASYAPAPVFGSLSGGGAAAPPGAPLQLAQNGPMQPGMLPQGVPPGIPSAPPPAAMAPVFGAFAPPATAAQPGMPPQGGMATGGALGQPQISPLQEAIIKLGVLSRLGKMGDVAVPLEQMYQNLPQVVQEKAAATARGQYAGPGADVALQGRLTGAKEAATTPEIAARDTTKAGLDRETKRLEQLGAAGLDSVQVTERLPDGSLGKRWITKAELAARVAPQAAGAAATAPSAAVPATGAPAAPAAPTAGAAGPSVFSEPAGLGATPEGYRLISPPDGGEPRLELMTGSPLSLTRAAAEGARQQGADIVTQDIGRALKLSNAWSTGVGGALFQGYPGTGAYNLHAMLDTIKANVGFDKLSQMRAASPTGGALGGVSNFEDKLLQSTMGSLEQSQSRGQFEANLKRLHQVFSDIVHGAPADLEKAVKEGKLSRAQYDQVMKRRDIAEDSGKSGVTPSGIKWSIQ